jgi:hypothetical protein
MAQPRPARQKRWTSDTLSSATWAIPPVGLLPLAFAETLFYGNMEYGTRLQDTAMSAGHAISAKSQAGFMLKFKYYHQKIISISSGL